MKRLLRAAVFGVACALAFIATMAVSSAVGGRGLLDLINLADSTTALTADATTQLKGTIDGLVVKKSSTALGAVTLATDEVMIGPSYEDMRVGAALRVGGTAPTLSQWGGTNVYIYKFATGEQLFFTTQLSHTWRLGTSIHPHVHWTTDDSTAASSGKVVLWTIDYTIADPDLQAAGAAPAVSLFAAPTTAITATYTFPDANERQYAHFLTEASSEIAMTTWTVPSVVIMGRLSRTAVGGGNDYAGDVFLVEFDFHFQVDGLGSDSELTKDY